MNQTLIQLIKERVEGFDKLLYADDFERTFRDNLFFYNYQTIKAVLEGVIDESNKLREDNDNPQYNMAMLDLQVIIKKVISKL